MSKIDLKIGYSCNDACIHCVVDDFRDALREKHQTQDKTLDQLKEEMTFARTRGDMLVVTGGEPSIRPDFPEILRFAHNLGFGLLIQTNGRKFSNMDLAKEIAQIPGIKYCIALHGPKAEIHDKVTQRKGSFDETVQGLKNLNALGQCVFNKIVLSRLNYQYVLEIMELLVKIGTRHISVAFPHAQGRARKMWSRVVPRYREVAPYLHKALDYASSINLPCDTETMMFCHMRGYEKCINELGQQLEEYAELNQYGSDSGIVNWSKVRPLIKKKFPQCQGCRFNLICEGPWNEYADHYGGEEFTPIYGQKILSPKEILDGSFIQEFSLER